MSITKDQIQEIINMNKQNQLQYQNILYYGIGLHPHYSYQWDDQLYDTIKQAVQNKFLIIGEIGIEMRDQFLEQNPLQQQKYVFEQQLQIAIEYNLPVSIHIVSRREGCWDYLQKIIQNKILKSQYNNILILHSYTGSFQQLQQLYKLYNNIAVGISYLNKDNKWTKRFSEFQGLILAESDYDGEENFDNIFNENIYNIQLKERILQDQQKLLNMLIKIKQ